mmetsp:Transcript_63209/g.186837  ORF Transcript_63209/g.186837 Transcript_63209/m.186837 type:complete len:185 (-) Transcript_63209:309-863(-)
MSSSMATRMGLFKKMNTHRKKFKPQLAEAAKKKKWNIYKGDTVEVIGPRWHKEFGKQGKVIDVNRVADRLTVEGVNIAPRRFKADPEAGVKGRIEMMPRSMHYSNFNLVDPVTGLATRVHRKFLEDGTKVRVAKSSGAIIPKPPILGRQTPISAIVTESDTKDEDVWEVTYNPPDGNKVVEEVK